MRIGRKRSSTMHAFDDQLAKKVLQAVYETSAVAHIGQEILPDAQVLDAWFEPDPAKDAEREKLGLLGRMMPGKLVTIFEPYSSTPGVREFRACQRKQLALGHQQELAAQKAERPEPAFPRMWLLSSGRPFSLLEGYGLTSLSDFPSGFWEGQPAEEVGLVVMRDLPHDRSTLLLRLMGGGEFRDKAVDELSRLPADAWERQVAVPALIAMRVELEQDPSNEAKEFRQRMDTVYKQWEEERIEKGRKKGRLEGRKEGRLEGRKEGRLEAHHKGLIAVYEARFGAMPAELRAIVEATNDEEVLLSWYKLVTTPSAEAFSDALKAQVSKANGATNGKH